MSERELGNSNGDWRTDGERLVSLTLKAFFRAAACFSKSRRVLSHEGDHSQQEVV